MAGRGRKTGPKGRSTALSVSTPQSAKPYRVALTQSAENVYGALRAKSDEAIEHDDSTNQHCTTFRMVDDAIRRLIPSEPTNRKYALHKPLDDFYRIAKGRLRIVWVVAPELRELLIVFISTEPRKEGDARDPYAILHGMAKAGYLRKIADDWRRALYTPPDAPIH